MQGDAHPAWQRESGGRLPRARAVHGEVEQLREAAAVEIGDVDADQGQPDAQQAGKLRGARRRVLERPDRVVGDQLEAAAAGVVEPVVLLHEERLDVQPDVLDRGIERDVQPVCQDDGHGQ